MLRPGHANFTYLEKYGVFDYRGGGRASARETACRVAAGAIAKKFLMHYNIQIIAYIKQIGTVEAMIAYDSSEQLYKNIQQSPLFCPDATASARMALLIEKAKAEGDSLGGVIEFIVFGAPTGLGDPVYEKLEANLAHAMMSLPATKGFEIGSGFKSVSMQGSEHNDRFIKNNDQVKTETNFAGGILGGISTGMPIIGRIAFKPTSSIMKSQQTLTTSSEQAVLELPQGSRHDPCVAIRAVPIVEAMAALVITDAVLLNRSAKL
jgi:chorismate synthase